MMMLVCPFVKVSRPLEPHKYKGRKDGCSGAQINGRHLPGPPPSTASLTPATFFFGFQKLLRETPSFAVDYSSDESSRRSGDDERLEIAKLGIAKKIQHGIHAPIHCRLPRKSRLRKPRRNINQEVIVRPRKHKENLMKNDENDEIY
ncbi:hypothetical protein ACFXTH_027978 [Malus domestica]